MVRWFFPIALSIAALAAAPARAKELEVTSRASIAIPPSDPNNPVPVDPLAIRAQALRAARLKAVKTAIDKVLGPDATRDPKVAGKIEAIAQQIPDDRIVDQKGTRIGNEYEMSITLVLDDKTFRTMLSDAGIAVNTATARAYSVLAVMDEFLTSPRDVRAPVEELEEFTRDTGATFRDTSSSSASSLKASAAASASTTQVKANAASSASASGSHDTSVQGSTSDSARLRAAADGAAFGAERSSSATLKGTDKGSYASDSRNAASLDARHAEAASASSVATKAASSKTNVNSSEHDVEIYRKLVKYQPQGGSPEKTSQTYNALMAQLQDYDLRVIDNDLFRSKYFLDRPMTIDEMQNGAELARYVAFARKDANADFFMIGTSIIIDSGLNPSTGEVSCTGVTTTKTYSTIDAESIASETVSEASSGRNINECAGNLARKMAAIAGPTLGARVQEYWKRRSAYGREFVLTLKGSSLPLMVRSAFGRAVKATPGVESDVQRSCGDKECQVVVSYKGTDPLDQAVANQLAANPAFASLDSRTEGNQVILCMAACSAIEAAPSPPPPTAPAKKAGGKQ